MNKNMEDNNFNQNDLTNQAQDQGAPNSSSKKIKLAAAAVIFLLVAFMGAAVFYWFYKKDAAPGAITDKNLFSGFSKLVISSAYAEDNFEFSPSKQDSAGVDPDSEYTLRSKESIDMGVIKENLKIEPEFEYKIQEISNKEWKIIPKEPIAANTLVKAAIASSYTDDSGQQRERDYSWVYQIKDSFRVLHSIPRDSGTYVPANTGIEITFSHDNFVDYEKYFEIEPQTEGFFEKHGRTLVFVPNNPLKAGALYAIKIKNGLPLSGSDEVLAEEYAIAFETAENRRQQDDFYIYKKNLEINSKDIPVIELSARNISDREAEVNVYNFAGLDEYLESLNERDKLPWWSYAKENYLHGTKNLKKADSFRAEIKSDGNKQYLEFLSTYDRGFYLAEINIGGNAKQIWMQVSDISAYLNVTKTDTIAWINDTIQGSPVGGAELRLIGESYAGVSNGDGIVKFPTPALLLEQAFDKKQAKRYYFKISKGSDILIMPASQVYRSYWWESPSDADDYWQYLYADRPRYQTTDTIKYWGMLKKREGGNIEEELTITLFKEGYVDYYYQPVKIIEQKINLSRIGTFEGEMKLNNVRPDYYTLEMKAGDKLIKRKYITVKPYTKPAYQIELIPDKKAAFAGEQVNLIARASFFEGTPAPNLKLVYNTPEGNKKVETNDKGEVNLSYTMAYVGCDQKYSCWPKYSHLSIKPEDSELAEISADTYLRFYGPKIYLETKNNYPEAGKAEMEMTAKFLDLENINEYYWQERGGEIAPATRIEGEVRKIKYIKKETGTSYDFINKVSYKTYSYERREEIVDNFSVITGQDGKYVYKRDVEPETSYEVKLKVYDSGGRFEVYNNYLYYYNGKYFRRYGDFSYSYYHFELPEGKNSYNVGEEVAARFMNNEEPMPDGEGRYLYLQLQNGFQEYQTSDKHEYFFNFEKRDIPNVNLVGVYFDGSRYITTRTNYFGKSVVYDNKQSSMDIKVSTDKDLYKPGENVTLNIKTFDMSGGPVQAEVNLNLIDEAYYAIASDYASPLETIYANVGPGSLYAEVTHDAPAKQSDTAELGGCFAGGTLVLMADGSRKPIEKIKKGDKIKTFSDPLNKEMVEAEVTEIWQNIAHEYLIINGHLKVTPEHQIFSNNRFTDAGRLKAGDWLLNYQGEKELIKSIKVEHEIIAVYNLRIDPEHTYFAGGYYVHNQEKGGGPREYFTDAVLFRSVRTDTIGAAEITFKLPDNITSWRVTAQGVSDELHAGISITKIPVSLPVFAEVTIGGEYLSADKPIARLRSYGAALKNGDEAYFNIDASSMGAEKQNILTAKAFQPVYYNFPELAVGKYDVIYNLKTAKGEDAIKLPVKVVKSRLEAQAAKSEKLTVETKVAAQNGGLLIVVISDEGQNRLYDPLQKLSWSWGDRVDQKLARKSARQILHDIYNEDLAVADFNAFDYQLQSGGVSLLPYSGEELELSARVASVGGGDFDKESLAQYFYKILENKQSNKEEISLSLYGLASLKKPVLPRIQSWLQRDDLSVKERIYLAQALFDLGAGEWSRDIYYEIINEFAEEKDPFIALRVEGGQDEVFRATALAAVLAVSLNMPQANGFWEYLNENQILYGRNKNSENLFNLEKINYINHALPGLKPSPAKVSYELLGERHDIEITGGKVHAFQLRPEDAHELKFIAVEGDAGISTRFTRPLNAEGVKKDGSLEIKREYYVNGKKSGSFSEKDIIEVRLYPSFGPEAITGNYQITDFLPSGLMPVTKLYSGSGSYDCHYWYPYNTDGQMVKYNIHNNWRNSYCGGDYIRYYARAKNRGEFKAEPAIIQSFVNPEYINFQIRKL